MEFGTSGRRVLAPKTLTLVLFLLSQIQQSSSSQPLHSNPIFSQSPTPPPTSMLPNNTTTNTTSSAHLRRILLGILFGSLTGVFASIVFLLLVRLFILFANRTPILKGPVIFSPRISSKSLQPAISTQCLSTNLLGSSTSGQYYRVELDDGFVVAVKRIENNLEGASPMRHSNAFKRQVQRELELLAKVKHENVMSLRGFVRDHDRFSLVYDYILNGSLEDVMKKVRSQQLRIGWDVRHRIAVGIVKGLRYLHFECSPRILHYRLKPTNVMLSEEFEPMLADCGLARLVPVCSDAAISACYVAPECFQSRRYTDKSDVFSFGMILAVLLTGKDPFDPFSNGESGRGGLGRWLRHLQQAGGARDALDKGIIGEEMEEDEMLMAVRIALVCLSDLPADRPSSDELVAMLTQLHSF
ncbi:putative transferase, protein kinase RLK-Pelle-LRR-XI-2 family [Dioscorea sansibarensis]